LLFKLAEDYRLTLDEGRGEQVYTGLLQTLDVYTRTHFGFEERCMERYHCPVAEKNKDAHAKFVVVLAGFRERHAANGFDRADARSLMDTLDRWLADHICSVDVHLKDCVKGS
jgi:hemerythrin